MYIRCTCGNVSREINIHTVIYGVYIRFWPTLMYIQLSQIPLNTQPYSADQNVCTSLKVLPHVCMERVK